MTRLLLACLVAWLALVALSVQAQETKVYQTDQFGRVQHSKPSLVVQPDGRIVEVDPYGHPRYDKPGFQVQGLTAARSDGKGSSPPSGRATTDAKIYATDQYGHQKQQVYVVRGDKVYQTDQFGNQRQQAYVIRGDKVYQTDQFGNQRQQAFKIQAPKPPPVPAAKKK